MFGVEIAPVWEGEASDPPDGTKLEVTPPAAGGAFLGEKSGADGVPETGAAAVEGELAGCCLPL